MSALNLSLFQIEPGIINQINIIRNSATTLLIKNIKRPIFKHVFGAEINSNIEKDEIPSVLKSFFETHNVNLSMYNIINISSEDENIDRIYVLVSKKFKLSIFPSEGLGDDQVDISLKHKNKDMKVLYFIRDDPSYVETYYTDINHEHSFTEHISICFLFPILPNEVESDEENTRNNNSDED